MTLRGYSDKSDEASAARKKLELLEKKLICSCSSYTRKQKANYTALELPIRVVSIKKYYFL